MGTSTPLPPQGHRRSLTLLVLFGIVFGYVEAAAVVYIRVMYEPIHQRLYPDRAPDDLFPLFSLERWSEEAPPHVNAPLEVGRELGTILLVAFMALAVSRDGRQWFASFLLAFGVWDLTYYLWLRLLTGWPHSLMDWDLVFAAPVPWVSPVLAPLLIAATMVVVALVFFWREATDRPIRPRLGHWLTALAAVLVMLAAFWWDYRHVLASGVPNPFNWPMLFLGIAMALAGFVHALITSLRKEQNRHVTCTWNP